MVTVSDRLKYLRSDIPGCHLVAFGDSEARLVLKASHDKSVPREVLDGLCTEAIACFKKAESCTETVSQHNECVVFLASEMRIYLHAQNQSDFLCILCDLESDPDIAVLSGMQVLEKLVGLK
ncbi:hypothetical protein NBRC116594_32740 [Shimia sp. NS0008-38b]